jgi:hypothetical protein
MGSNPLGGRSLKSAKPLNKRPENRNSGAVGRARVDLPTKRGPHATDRRFLAFAMLDTDRVVPLNEANVVEYLFHRTQFCHRGGYDEMLD